MRTRAVDTPAVCAGTKSKFVYRETIWTKQRFVRGTIERLEIPPQQDKLGPPSGIYLKIDKDIPFDNQPGFVIKRGSHLLLGRGFENAAPGAVFGGMCTVRDIVRGWVPVPPVGDHVMDVVHVLDKLGAKGDVPKLWRPER